MDDRLNIYNGVAGKCLNVFLLIANSLFLLNEISGGLQGYRHSELPNPSGKVLALIGFLFLLAVFFVVKEFKIKPLALRLILNVVILVSIVVLTSWIY